MNLVFRSRASLAVLICFAVVRPTTASAAEPPLSIEEVAKIFGYPAEKLKVEEVTEQVNRRAERRGKPQAISVHTFSDTNDTFARFSIAIANEGTLLTEDIKRYVAEAIPKLKQKTGTNLYLNWVTFEKAGYGVSGLGMVGPGGSEEWCVMTLANGPDVQVKVITGRTPLEVLPGAEQYHELVTEGRITPRLIECLSAVASRKTGKPIKAILSDHPPAGALPKDPVQKRAKRQGMKRVHV